MYFCKHHIYYQCTSVLGEFKKKILVVSEMQNFPLIDKRTNRQTDILDIVHTKICKLRTCVIKIVACKGGHLM